MLYKILKYYMEFLSSQVARVLGDLQDPSTCTAIVSKTREAFGCLDILVILWPYY